MIIVAALHCNEHFLWWDRICMELDTHGEQHWQYTENGNRNTSQGFWNIVPRTFLHSTAPSYVHLSPNAFFPASTLLSRAFGSSFLFRIQRKEKDSIFHIQAFSNKIKGIFHFHTLLSHIQGNKATISEPRVNGITSHWLHFGAFSLYHILKIYW